MLLLFRLSIFVHLHRCVERVVVVLVADWKENLFGDVASTTVDRRRSTATSCYSCTSIDASEIIGGAGVHPGVYLTSILLSTIPVTARCHDPFFDDGAPSAGVVASPICEDGLCVKINYTDKQNGRWSHFVGSFR
jgi:hypothetical protein